jgi:hypothetical protein
MFRRLVLSVLDVFFAEKSALLICTAFLLALFFLLLHVLYLPFKNETLNRLQFVNLLVLLLMYFGGLLFKLEFVAGPEKDGFGVLLFILAISAILLYALALVYMLVVGNKQLKLALHAFTIEFQGKIIEEEGKLCVASFPGKYEELWHECVSMGHDDEFSIACVFLPSESSQCVVATVQSPLF